MPAEAEAQPPPVEGPLGRRSKRIKTVLTFIRNLNERLSKEAGDTVATDTVIKEMREHINGIRTYHAKKSAMAPGDEEIENQGTQLWNRAVRLKRELREENDPTSARLKKFVLVSRVLVFYFLTTQWSEGMPFSGKARFMKLALNTARLCLDDASELPLATEVLVKAVDFNSHLKTLLPTLEGDDAKECSRFEADYLILRVVQSWKDDRLDVAEHMYGKAAELRSDLDTAYAEKLAEVLYRIGKSLAAKHDHAIAIKWLDRARDIIVTQDLEHLSREGALVRLAIQQALVTTLLGRNDKSDRERAGEIIRALESEIGKELLVSLLTLELLEKVPPEEFDARAYSDVLRHLVVTFTCTEEEFNILIHHIHTLHGRDPGLACGVTDEFIPILCSSGHDDWLQRLVLGRILMATSQGESPKTIDATQLVLSKVKKPLDGNTALSALIPILRNVEASYEQEHYDAAGKWCQLSLHPVFQNCGPANLAKLERKLLLCAIMRDDMEAAMSAIHSMSEKTRAEPMSGYLMFKVAVRIHDEKMAEEGLELVSRAREHIDYLTSCVVDGQHARDVLLTTMALKKLLSKYQYTPSSPVLLPALLRCTIRLFIQLLDAQDCPAESRKVIVQDIVKIFSAAIIAIKRDPRGADGKKLFDIEELNWFSRNAYNLGMQYAGIWGLDQTIEMLGACIQIIDLFPKNLDTDASGDLSLRAMFSHFAIVAALLGLARTQDDVESKARNYHVMRGHVAAFYKQAQSQTGNLGSAMYEDVLGKLATLLTYDFEAASHLKTWDDLAGIVQKAAFCRKVTAFYAMGDCLLRSGAPGQVTYSTMRKIVNEIYGLEDFNTVKLAKYVRCLFQLTLPLGDELALSVIEEACNMARESSESTVPWPSEELEWLATTAWNHGVGCYSDHMDHAAVMWFSSAITLAQYQGDNRTLESSMKKYFSQLNFGVLDSDAV